MAFLKFFDTPRNREPLRPGSPRTLDDAFLPRPRQEQTPGTQHQIKVIMEGLGARAVRFSRTK